MINHAPVTQCHMILNCGGNDTAPPNFLRRFRPSHGITVNIRAAGFGRDATLVGFLYPLPVVSARSAGIGEELGGGGVLGIETHLLAAFQMLGAADDDALALAQRA